LVFLGVLFWLASWVHSWWPSAQFFFEVVGMYLALLAFIFAERAFNQSRKTQHQMEDLIHSLAETATEFDLIFERHLVNRLREYKHVGGKICLLLSTPAYGYAVVGPDRFKSFVDAFSDLDADCVVEIIFFSPDDHFDYWANVIVWSEIRPGETEFAKGFASSVSEIFAKLRARRPERSRIWITRTTTVRVFAFLPLEGKPEDPHERIYVAFTDLFSISQDQYRARFKARSIRIAQPLKEEFIERPGSYFERIKVCPYTGRTMEEAALDQKNYQAQLGYLHADYVLGRTRDNVMDRGVFKSEMQAFLKSESVTRYLKERELSGSEEILRKVITHAVSYFGSVLGDESAGMVGMALSENQASQLGKGLKLWRQLEPSCAHRDRLTKLIYEKFPTLDREPDPPSPPSAQALSTNEMATFPPPPPAGQLSAAFTPRGDGNRATQDNSEALIECLYLLMTSGLGESTYAKSMLGYSVSSSRGLP
jgi:hypothetical protein